MAHFALLDENNIVIDVQRINDEDMLDENGVEQESLGIAFLHQLFGQDKTWVQTSINANFRKYYARIGWKYYPDLDAFIYPQPYPSWILDPIEKEWLCPVPEPVITDPTQISYWDEKNQVWYVIYVDQRFPSWVFNQTTQMWEAPVPIPADYEENNYEWNEDELCWYHVYWDENGNLVSIKV
jgi:hypothetical protein